MSKMIDQSSLTSITISFFRASLLFVALLSTFYAHNLPIISGFIVSYFLFLNIMFVCNNMSTYDRLLMHPRNLHEEDHIDELNVVDDKPQVADVRSVLGSVPEGRSGLGAPPDEAAVCEEDSLIEIAIEKEEVDMRELVSESEDFLSEMDNLIEIDISMGSIRNSGSGLHL